MSHNAKLVQKHSEAEYSRRYERMMQEYQQNVAEPIQLPPANESSEDLPPANESSEDSPPDEEDLEFIFCICRRCNGTGRIRVGGYESGPIHDTCPKCQGKGKCVKMIPCVPCSGTGRIRVGGYESGPIYDTCRRCDGLYVYPATQECPECNPEDESCFRCHGEGYI